ncbi:unnamed protein product [Danaus chrysippus]|uniref:(African queen) hypothetical protein n=1 Tax=Danaus chrysippus TaxID=151541 RepID=A0A8J2QKW5_9NEOP|nr:unnamed protein product [Danaus chrysippus]
MGPSQTTGKGIEKNTSDDRERNRRNLHRGVLKTRSAGCNGTGSAGEKMEPSGRFPRDRAKNVSGDVFGGGVKTETNSGRAGGDHGTTINGLNIGLKY